jgi:hypothetical protein
MKRSMAEWRGQQEERVEDIKRDEEAWEQVGAKIIGRWARLGGGSVH